MNTRRRLSAALAVMMISTVLGISPSTAQTAGEPALVSTTPADGSSVQAAPTVSATYDVALHPSSTLQVWDRTGTSISGATAVDAATITFTPTAALTEAGSPYTASATVRDATTNTLETTSTWTFSIDVIAPAAPAITSVEGDDTSPALGNDPTPTIMVSGVVAGDSVAISEGATVLASKVVPTGADTVTFNAAETDAELSVTVDGDHTLAATATDPAGNTSAASAGFVYTLDTTAPAAPGIASVHGDSLSPAAGNDTTPAIVVSGVVEGDTVVIAEGATVLGSKVVPAGADTVTFNAAETDAEVNLIGDRDHTLTATATDPAGNTSAASAGFVYTLDTSAPAAPSITSVEGDATSPAAGNDATPTIVVSGVAEGDTVAIAEGATVLGSKVVPAGATTVTFNAAEADAEVNLTVDGDHVVTASATDPFGNTSAASASFIYYLDTGTVGPTLVSNSPDGSSAVRPPATVSATYDEPLDPSTSTLTVLNRLGNAVAGTISFSGDARTITFTPSSSFTEAGGPYAVTAEVRDVNANLTTTSWSFTVDTTAPAVSTIISVNGDTTSPALGNDPTPAIVVSGVVEGDTVTISEGATVLASKVVPTGADTVTFNAGEADSEVSLTGEGDHTLSATASDPAGNVSATSPGFVYTLDTTAPGIAAIASVEGDANSPAVSNDATPTIVVSGVAAGDTVTISEGTTVLGSKVVAGGATTVTFNAAEADSDLVVSLRGDHSLSATATDPANNTSAPSAGFVYTLVSFEGTFHPLSPARILDTREGNGAPRGKVTGTISLQVTGRGGVPASGVTSVVINVTVTEPTRPSFLTAWPAGQTRPTASNLNYTAGQTVPNLAVVKVGTGGRVNLFNFSGGAHVVADVVGWYSNDTVATSGARYEPLSPARILDTREGNGAPRRMVGPGGTVSLQVTDRGGVPASGVSAVVMNVTVTQPTASSVLTAWPSGETQPNASNLNYTAGQTVPNLVVVKVGAEGKVNLRNLSGYTHVVADVVGWYSDTSATSGARYQALSPARILDTREGNGAPKAKVSGTLSLQVTGRGGVPASGVSAIVMNVTVTEPTASSVLTVWPAGELQPNASNLNYTAGQTVPNLVAVKVGTDGKVNLRNFFGSTHVVADVVGWYNTE
ncbi:MAG: hypothetical protein KY452_02835 [Actinobacteria bacterium]|nr:hypothetical protein [Actinomycetota bacterium]